MKHDTQRKFLVNELWRPNRARGIRCRQGYLSVDPDRLVRVVTAGEQGLLTIKRISAGRERTVLDYDIPLGEADLLLDALCLPPVLEKERYREVHGGRIWIIEEFVGENRGLTLAETEVASPESSVARPTWLGDEVTGDPRYFSSNLWRHPFTRWARNRHAVEAGRGAAGEPLATFRP